MVTCFDNVDTYCDPVDGGPYSLREWVQRVEAPIIHDSPSLSLRERVVLFALACCHTDVHVMALCGCIRVMGRAIQHGTPFANR